MSRYLFVLLALILSFVFTATVMAAKPENPGPKIIKLKMGKETIQFTHHKHQKVTNNQCWECHDKKSGKISNWNEATAHKICIPCHDLNEKGPVSCKGCHKK
ncbi:MAG: cytochrome C [Deltaproteobacteria bacterium HGW-Deltaproteobacteria-23]|nr:MAG: cytochrome C [Deltaproteobacteria bacterium HGW-Deltaproteobacteria-23]